MAKLTLDDVGNFNSTGLTTINENSSRIESALENTLSRDGTSPNQMEADLDMNHNDIINVDNIDVDTVQVETLYIDGSLVTPDELIVANAELLDGMDSTEFLWVENNLSDVGDKDQARENLSLLSYEEQSLTDTEILQTQDNIGLIRFDTVSDLLADTILADVAASGKVVVAEGDIVEAQGFRYEVAASGATDQHLETAGGVKLYVLRVTNRLFLDAFGMIPSDEDSAATNKAIMAKVLAATATARGSKIVEAGPHTYWFDPGTALGAAGIVLQSSTGAVFKRPATSENTTQFTLYGADDARVVGIEIDGNRDNDTGTGEFSLLTISNSKNVIVEKCKIHSSRAKGLSIASGVAGSIGAIDCGAIDCEAWNCGQQAFLTDRSNLTGDDTIPCLRPFFVRCKVGDTGHAGIAINDGTLGARVIDCDVDVNNSTWHAIAVRGSRNTLVKGCTGRRGNCGFQAYTLSLDAISRGEYVDGLTLIGNFWEDNKQAGAQFVGATNFVVVGDIAKNNGQTSTNSGFSLNQNTGVRRSSNGSLIGVHAFDDQDTATQEYGITIAAVDNIKIVSPTLHGNATAPWLFAGTNTGIEITGDGADGATMKRVSASTGEIAASGSAEVDVAFTTAFAIAPNHAVASVLSATAGLVVDNIVSLSTTKAVVRVSNTSAGALTGTVYVTAELFI